MALFLDGPVSAIEDLTAQDSQLLDIANIESIDVTAKLALAHEDLAVDLQAMTDTDLATVAATPSLKLWHTFRTLEMVYSDAYNSQLNDRYAGKRDGFGQRARWAREKLREIGLGIVSSPVSRAVSPTVSEAPGNLPAGTWYTTVAWANSQGAEGESAVWSAITLESGSLMVTPGPVPANAAGWHVYLGAAPDSMVRQNDSLLAVGQTWLPSGVVRTNGPAPGAGQSPDVLQPIPRLIQRG